MNLGYLGYTDQPLRLRHWANRYLFVFRLLLWPGRFALSSIRDFVFHLRGQRSIVLYRRVDESGQGDAQLALGGSDLGSVPLSQHRRGSMGGRFQMASVIALSILACADPTFSRRGVRVTLTVDKTVFYQGDVAHVTVTAVNRGREVVTINDFGCPARFDVIDGGGSVGSPGPQICSALSSLRDLSPGDSLMIPYSWRLNDAKDRPLAPGHYKLRGRAIGRGFDASSAPVAIQIASHSQN